MVEMIDCMDSHCYYSAYDDTEGIFNISLTMQNTTNDTRNEEVAIFLSVMMAILIVTTITGNTLILSLTYLTEELRTNTAVFVVNLAVADVLVGTLLMPVELTSCIANRWVFGSVFCSFNGVVNSAFCIASMLTLCCISLDRYYAICHPLRYRNQILTPKHMVVMVVWIWTHSLLLGVLALTNWSYYEYFPSEYLCTVAWSYSPSYTLFTLLSSFFSAGVVMCFCYYHILLVARGHRKRVAVQRNVGQRRNVKTQELRTAAVLLLVIGTYLFCWTPHITGILCITFTDCKLPEWFFTMSTWLAMGNSSLNPLIYGVLDRRYRRALLKLCCNRIIARKNESTVEVIDS